MARWPTCSVCHVCPGVRATSGRSRAVRKVMERARRTLEAPQGEKEDAKEIKVLHHEGADPDKSATMLRLAVEAAEERRIETLVVASRSGATALQVMERIGDANIRMVVVSPQYGWMEEHEFDPSLIPRLSNAGHAFYAGRCPSTPMRSTTFRRRSAWATCCGSSPRGCRSAWRLR